MNHLEPSSMVLQRSRMTSPQTKLKNNLHSAKCLPFKPEKKGRHEEQAGCRKMPNTRLVSGQQD